LKHITAQDIYNYVKCPYRVYLDENGNPADKGEVNSFIELLWEMGIRNEKEVVATLGKEIVEVSEDTQSKSFEKTIELMKRGVPLIYHGCLIDNNKLGIPDLLVRCNDHASDLGPYYYEAIEIKSGKGVKDERQQKFKEHYAFQVIFYNDLLSVFQGYAPLKGKIINGDKQMEEFLIDDYRKEYKQAFEDVEKLKNDAGQYEPIISSACSSCVWNKHCFDWAKKNNDPTLIYFVGKNKYLLKSRGLDTIEKIASMEIDKYLKAPLRMKGLAEKTLKRMKKRAQVNIQGKPLIDPGYDLPSSPTEIYFDVEDDPTQGFTYLFGLYIISNDGKTSFKYFIAKKPEDEEKIAREFWDFMESMENAVYYVYSPKEKSTLKRLMGKYNLSEEIYQKYLKNEFDLYTKLVSKYSDWPGFSYGLKQIAKQIGFKWRDEDPSGANSIAWYNKYLQTQDEAILKRILEYNEDDCKATYEVKQFFEKSDRLTFDCELKSAPRSLRARRI